MFYNLKIAIRNLKFNKTYSAINIVGLAVSLATCVFIFLWVQDEKSYDHFHKDAENIYTAVAHFKSDGGTHTVDITPGLLAPVAEQNFSEVTSYCRLLKTEAGLLQAGDLKTGRIPVIYADSTFFSFFNFPIIKGEANRLLNVPDGVVISERLSKELFGSEDPVGRSIVLEGKTKVYVAAVMKDFPSNTTLPYADVVCPFKTLSGGEISFFLEILDSWGSCEYLTYLRLKPGTNPDLLAQKMTGRQAHMQETRSFTLMPLVNMHLYSLDGNPTGLKTVQLFQWIALIILCIACVNYINLVTARSSKRQREIGVSKILGANKKQLFSKLTIEAGVLFVAAILLAVILNMALLPGYNQLSGKELSLSWFTGNIWTIYGWMLLFIIIIAGLYPAWVLASFNPVNVIQKKNGSIIFRRVLVVLQFVSSAVLIMGTITLQTQMKYMRDKNLGYDKEHVLTCELFGMAGHYSAVKAELMQNPAILGVTGASADIMDVVSSNGTDSWEGKEDGGSLSYTQLSVDSAFLNVMQIPLKEGEGATSGDEKQFIINETAARAMGIKEPVVGKWMIANGFRGTIAGVVKDFHFNNLHKEIDPLVIFTTSFGSVLYVRTTAKDAHQAITAIEKLWKQYNPDYTFTYHFMDETFDQAYRSDIRIGWLFGIFSLIAILISCLGLFGLVTFTAEMKTKEIGIRKVMGASVSDIVNLLSKEFLVLVGIAMLIAFPLAYLLLDKMLLDYAYRISIAWWMFVLAAVVTLALTLITVGFQSIKAATANPIESIKTE